MNSSENVQIGMLVGDTYMGLRKLYLREMLIRFSVCTANTECGTSKLSSVQKT